MALRLLRLLLHILHAPIFVHDDHARSLQLLHRGLLVAHNAARLLGKGEIDKLLEREEEDIIGRHDQHIVVDREFFHRIEQVADGPQARLVGLGAVIDDRQRLGVVLFGGPLLEDRGEFMVRNNDMFVDLGDAVDIIQHTAQNSALADLQEGLGKILGQFTQPRCIPCCYYYVFHSISVQHSALSCQLLLSLLILDIREANILLISSNESFIDEYLFFSM